MKPRFNVEYVKAYGYQVTAYAVTIGHDYDLLKRADSYYGSYEDGTIKSFKWQPPQRYLTLEKFGPPKVKKIKKDNKMNSEIIYGYLGRYQLTHNTTSYYDVYRHREEGIRITDQFGNFRYISEFDLEHFYVKCLDKTTESVQKEPKVMGTKLKKTHVYVLVMFDENSQETHDPAKAKSALVLMDGRIANSWDVSLDGVLVSNHPSEIIMDIGQTNRDQILDLFPKSRDCIEQFESYIAEDSEY